MIERIQEAKNNNRKYEQLIEEFQKKENNNQEDKENILVSPKKE